MTAKLSAAIAYTTESYETQSQKVVGRKSAGEGFLKGYVQHGCFDRLLCYATQKALFENFREQVKGWASRSVVSDFIHPQHPELLGDCGVLFRPDILINRFAWQRSTPTAYSLCGITYSLSTREVFDAIAEFPVAPLYPWDAVVCASEVGKKAIEAMLAQSREYLKWRFKVEPVEGPTLPVIPLGIDTSPFLEGQAREQARSRIRGQLGVAAEEIVVLYTGRINSVSKANPIPLFLGVEQASQDGKPVTLVLAGWFETDEDEQAVIAAAKRLASNVKTLIVRRPSTKDLIDIYAAGDIFVSLADNIQETFGLTPVEAMAAGLPVIVSDWNGYRETVRNGVDGITVPTIIPEASAAHEISQAHHTYSINYGSFVGNLAMSTAVDIPKFVEALRALRDSTELRSKLGNSGRERARKMFDWRNIIPQYEKLWSELQLVRVGHKNTDTSPGYNCPEVFKVFAPYATHQLSANSVIGLGACVSKVSALRASRDSNFSPEGRVSNEAVDRWLQILVTEKELSIEKLTALTPDASRAQVMRTVGTLLKFNVCTLKK